MIYSLMRGLTLVLLLLGQILLSEVQGILEMQHDHHVLQSKAVSASSAHSHNETSESQETTHHGQDCALHCICHHVLVCEVKTFANLLFQDFSSGRFVSRSRFYLDPTLDPWLRPPLSA